jgi:hypothetical protein
MHGLREIRWIKYTNYNQKSTVMPMLTSNFINMTDFMTKLLLVKNQWNFIKINDSKLWGSIQLQAYRHLNMDR